MRHKLKDKTRMRREIMRTMRVKIRTSSLTLSPFISGDLVEASDDFLFKGTHYSTQLQRHLISRVSQPKAFADLMIIATMFTQETITAHDFPLNFLLVNASSYHLKYRLPDYGIHRSSTLKHNMVAGNIIPI